MEFLKSWLAQRSANPPAPYHVNATVHRETFWFNVVSFMIWQSPLPPPVPPPAAPTAPDPAPSPAGPIEDLQARNAELAEKLRTAELRLHHLQQQQQAVRDETADQLQVWNQELEQRVQERTEELARSQATLRLSEERLRLALASASLGVWHVNLGTGEASWSAESQALLGFAPGEFDGTYESFSQRIHPDDRQRVLQQRDAARLTPHYQVDYRVVWPDQTIRWIASRGRVHYDERGQPASINGVDWDISDRQHQVAAGQRAAAQLQTALHAKEVLLQEIHHRVKNNLQIISSLLRMQARHVQDPQTRFLLQDSQNRVQSIALIHDQLSTAADRSQIDFGDYVEQLVSHVFRSYGVSRQAIALDITTDGIHLTLHSAIPCGLIINELVSNTLKYAFPPHLPTPSPAKRITIRLQSLGPGPDAQFALTVQDNGVGITPTLQGQQSPTLGLRIVRNLVTQLQGSLQLQPITGTGFYIVFPQIHSDPR